MKLIIKFSLFLCIVLAYQCKQSETQQIAEDHSYLAGTYHWKYPKEYESTLDEDNTIVLRQDKEKLEGFYYGTTDEFDQAREGYYPGYFVLKMDSLTVNGDSIFFILRMTSADIFEKPVDVSAKSTQEALDKGYAHSGNFDGWFLHQLSKKYKGIILDSTRIYFEPDNTGMPEKNFLKISN